MLSNLPGLGIDNADAYAGESTVVVTGIIGVEERFGQS